MKIADSKSVSDSLPELEALSEPPALEVQPIEFFEEANKPSRKKKDPSTDRFVALDAFRGLTVLLMLLVNNLALDASAPTALVHAAWNQGITLADYVFPWFLLSVGLSIPFSFRSFRKTSLPAWRMDLRILFRSTILFGLGCLINHLIEPKLFLSLGVLQLIGMAYFIGAIVYDLPISRRLIIATILIVGYGLAVLFLPIPGFHTGTFTEQANFFGNINRIYLAPYNIDGLFSAIPTGSLIIIASVITDVVLSKKLNSIGNSVFMLFVGALLISLGVACAHWIPYNKPVWTPSYVLVTGGTGLAIVACFYGINQFISFKNWTMPLVVLGSNPILAYVLPVIFKLVVFATWIVETPKGKITAQQASLDALVGVFGRVTGGWVYTATYIVFWWLILALMYRKRLFLRI